MINKKEYVREVVYEFSSEMAEAHNVIADAHEFIGGCTCKKHGVLKLVLRELFSNAVQHGNKGIRLQTVSCTIAHLEEGGFKVTVEDRGSGFEYSDIATSLTEHNACTKRKGYAIISAFADKIELNDRGNCVTVHINPDCLI